jgi:protein TonB
MGIRLSSFLIVSIALHATILVYPVVFLRPEGKDFVPVVLIALDDGNTRKSGGNGPGAGDQARPTELKQHALLQINKPSSSEENKQPSEPPSPIQVSFMPVDVPAGIEVPSEATATEARGSFLGQLARGNGEGGGGGGKGNSSNGVGSGSGVGDGTGASRFVQASYAYSPKPEYPDKARKEGKEGRVVLRVLVDEDGKSKSVEVNDSSGSETLDRAAAEAIKRWLFSPAHYGNKSVESWVKIPIDFRLTDVKN